MVHVSAHRCPRATLHKLSDVVGVGHESPLSNNWAGLECLASRGAPCGRSTVAHKTQATTEMTTNDIVVLQTQRDAWPNNRWVGQCVQPLWGLLL
jgi:hypothetical protein